MALSVTPNFDQLHPVQRPARSVAEVITPSTLDHALELMSEYGRRAKPVAGGTDLMIELDRAAHPDVEVLIDLTRIAGLDRIDEVDGRISIGALVTHNRCVTSELIVDRARPLAQACHEIGSPQLRNRATVVGNIVTASPANDSISALAVLDAELELRSVNGTRVVPLAEFHTGVRSTLLNPDELVTAVTFDALDPEHWRSLYIKLGLRRAQAISVVHLAVALRLDRSTQVPTVVEARLALGSVAPVIVRADDAEVRLVGEEFGPGSVWSQAATEAASAAAASVQPIDDVRSPAWYRSVQVEEMTRRALVALAVGDGVESPGSSPHGPVTLAGTTSGYWPTGDGFAARHTAGARIETTINHSPLSAPVDAGAAGSDSGPRSGAAVSLLDWLRENGLTGTKEGCAEGECGACTVHLDDMAVLSCLVPATRAHGAHVLTIEGVAPATRGAIGEPGDQADQGHNGAILHPLQRAFVDHGAVQCGYCIPGFLMSGVKLLEEVPSPTDDEVKAGLAGNLCRCTGYYPIETAVMVAAANARVTRP